MKQAYVILLWSIILLLGRPSTYGQAPNRLAEALKSKTNQRSEEAIPAYDLFVAHQSPELKARHANLVSRSTHLILQKAEVRRIERLKPDVVELRFPFQESQLEVQLFREDPVADNYQAVISDGRTSTAQGVHYRGIIKGDNQSIAAISIFDEEVIGIFSSTPLGNVILGKTPQDDIHVLYLESDLLVDNEHPACEALQVPGREEMKRVIDQTNHQRNLAECVQVYFETSYSLFQNKGSYGAVENYVTGLFNAVSALYANEGISIEMSQIYIWVSQDPYSHSSASSALSSFIQKRPNFNGTVGHLLDLTGALKGGLAYVDVLCDNGFNVGYSDINASYNSLPTYSWTVNVVAHELGHNFGSQHTHDCVWGPQNCTAIDACGAPSPGVGCGSCSGATIPSKGTIMSYCHVGGNGIDFNLGFGSEPGNLIRARTAAASCLVQCGSGSGGGGCTLFIDAVTVNDASCGQDNGQVVVSISGESGSVTYDIGNGQQSNNVFNNLAAGNYTLTVTNGAGCDRSENFSVQLLSEEPTLEATITNATCGEKDGQVELSAAGGQGPYSYRLEGKTQSNPTFNNLGVGNYTAVVTDNEGCTAQKPFAIFTDNAPTVSANIQHTSCGSSNGSIALSAEGGMAPYVYRIEGETSSNGDFPDMAAGTYTVEVIDNNGCIDDRAVTIKSSEPIQASTTTKATQCGLENGELKVAASGGSGILLYSVGSSFQSVPTFSNVAAGSYEVRIKDEAGCLITLTEEVEGSETFALAPVVERTTCGLDNGRIDLEAEGNTGPYDFRIAREGFFTAKKSYTDLASGTYLIEGRDADGCIVNDEVTVSGSSNPIPLPELDDTHCGLENGSIAVAVKGGIAPYSYQLNAETQSDSTFNDLASGRYMVRVTDDDGCIDSVEVRVDTSEAAFAQLVLTPTSCGADNGVVAFEALTGVAPFAYSVSDVVSETPLFANVAAGMHVVQLADADQCSWYDTIVIEPSNAIHLSSEVTPTSCGRDNGAVIFDADGGTGELTFSLLDTSFGSQAQFEALPAGRYQMRVRDQEDCIVTEEVEVLPSSNPRIDQQVVHTRCGQENGSLLLSSIGGEGPFQYWMNGDSLKEDVVSGLSAGNYQLLVKDRFGCVDSTTTAIETSTAPVLSVQTTPASCYQANGQIEVSGELGIGPYAYSIGQSYVSTSQFSDLDSGEYVVVLRDQRDCLDTLETLVQYDDQYKTPILPVSRSICEMDPAILDIGLSVIPNITWTRNGMIVDHEQPTLTTDVPGKYQATIFYHEACTLSAETNVTVEKKPQQMLVASDTICRGQPFTISEVDPTLKYEWSNDSTGTAVAFQRSDRYELTVINDQQCSITKSVDLTVVQPITFEYAQDTAYICQGESYQWNLEGADEYTWLTEDASLSSLESNNPIATPSADQHYLVRGTNQCFDAELDLYLRIYQDVAGHVQDTTLIEGSPLNLYVDDQSQIASWEGPFEFECTDCLTTLIRPTESGELQLTYTDINGCAWTESITIDVIPLSEVLPPLINVITPNGDGRNDVLAFDQIEEFKQFKLQVFNADGNLLYQSQDYRHNWSGTFDGDLLPEGVYYYILSILMDDRVFQFDSDLTIVRD